MKLVRTVQLMSYAMSVQLAGHSGIDRETLICLLLLNAAASFFVPVTLPNFVANKRVYKE